MAQVEHESQTKGMFYPDGSFKSEQQVRREMALRGEMPPVLHDRRTVPTMDDYLSVASMRAKQMRELSPVRERATISLPETSVVHVIADTHLGNPNSDIERLRQEIEAIKNSPNHYIALDGDLVDGIFWGGASQAEQSLNLQEQHGLLRSMFKDLKGKIVWGISGQHDAKWAAKTGSDPYEIMEEVTGAPYFRGVAEIKLEVGEQEYNIVAQHQAPGHSMYNKNHPTFRESRFGLQGGDVYISADTHKKQIAQETVRGFDGARIVTHIATGTYKTGDEFLGRKGVASQKPEEMYGASIRLHSDEKRVDVDYDILHAVKEWNED